MGERADADRCGAVGSEAAAAALDLAFAPPFEVVEPDELSSCVVLSSPHSGRIYPARFLASARLDPVALRRSEDAFVDDLMRGAVAGGMPLLTARFPRAYLDVNREPYELDPRMFEGRLPPYVNSRSLRVAGGLGTIPRVVGEAQDIYRQRLSVEDGIGRIEALYKPYHAALQALLDRAVARFGCALLVDCHSMPSSPFLAQACPGARDERLKADFVIGDRFGTSCARALADRVEAALAGFGYVVERNKPYAGGYITEHYGHPDAGRHALQIEVNRALYMNERTLTPTDGFALVADRLGAVMGQLGTLMREGFAGGGRLAAE